MYAEELLDTEFTLAISKEKSTNMTSSSVISDTIVANKINVSEEWIDLSCNKIDSKDKKNDESFNKENDLRIRQKDKQLIDMSIDTNSMSDTIEANEINVSEESIDLSSNKIDSKDKNDSQPQYSLKIVLKTKTFIWNSISNWIFSENILKLTLSQAFHKNIVPTPQYNKYLYTLNFEEEKNLPCPLSLII